MASQNQAKPQGEAETPVSGALPLHDLFDRLASGENIAILCATNRLARNLQLAFARSRSVQGEGKWPTPRTTSVQAWFDGIGEQISLQGEIAVREIPDRVLNHTQECLVLQQAFLTTTGDDNPGLALFDLRGLAKTAAEAQALIDTWNLQLADTAMADETRLFMRWRRQFKAICRKNRWSSATEYQKLVLDWIERGAGKLPAHVVLAGFDSIPPMLHALQATLQKRGVALSQLEFSITPAHAVRVATCTDAEAECQAAAAWAQEVLDIQPDARIGIVVADLETRRETVMRCLDAALDPDALTNCDDTPSRKYNLSLGLPLLRHGLVRTALALLRLLGRPRGLPLAEFGALLRMPYWSADQTEADWRARVDAKLREKPGQDLPIGAVLRTATHLGMSDASQLQRHLKLLKEAQAEYARAKLPSAWARIFRNTLDRLGWPGERTLSSAEFQTRAAFFDTLAELAELDAFLGPIGIAQASTELTQLCKEKIFQPQTRGQPPIEVLGLLEATGTEFDALWVMGMNDQLWPPPPHPNPLLPADLQRRQQTPGASAEVQHAFARNIQQRLLHSAPTIVFSHARQDGERELRPSPLIADLMASAPTQWPASAAMDDPPVACEFLDDTQAPPLADGEEVHGGSGLLKAQAICPAWAFYRYRLGAKKLETPTEGLDASRRGTLVHAMLEAFWNMVKDSVRLHALAAAELHTTIATAAEFALAQFESLSGEKLSATFRELEARRLQRICRAWLAVDGDAARPPFRVIACEEKHAVALGRLRINLVIDRIDALLDDGRRIVLDYKTGGALDTQNWFGDRRIVEPQLPLYAAIILAQPEQPPVAAVAFAKVRLKECRFQGIAAAPDLLPGVDALAAHAEIASPLDPWHALLDSWKTRLESIADEIRRGEAAVRVADERLLMYSDVLPLLRLAERRRQFENRQEDRHA